MSVGSYANGECASQFRTSTSPGAGLTAGSGGSLWTVVGIGPVHLIWGFGTFPEPYLLDSKLVIWLSSQGCFNFNGELRVDRMTDVQINYFRGKLVAWRNEI